MDITLQGHVEQDDYAQSVRTFYWHQRQVRIVAGALAVFFIAGTGFGLFGGPRAFGMGVFFASLLPIYLLYLLVVAPNVAAKKMLQFNGPGGATTLHISAANLIAKNARSETTYSWDEFTRFREAPAVFVLFFSTSAMFLIIPKRFIESPAAEAELRQFLIQKLGPA